MKYEAPYGVSDPNASYINGNPSTGTMGSIPPAASIENPQREIVNLIKDAALTPTDVDLHQLAKGVQSGVLVYAVDFGTANTYSVNVVPPLTAYAAGQRWGIKVRNSNTGASTLNINGLGGRNIVYPAGAALVGNEMPAGAVVTLIDDGTRLQLQNVQMNLLTAPQTYYVNASTGSDTLYDGTTATITGSQGPFATINRGIEAAHTWNQNGFDVFLSVADGTYAQFQCSTPPNGSGSIWIIGNNTNPIGVLIHATAGEAILVQADGYRIQGMSLQSDSNGAAPHVGAGIRLIGCTTIVTCLNFAACVAAHMHVTGSANLIFTGLEDGSPNDFYSVTGDSPNHMECLQNSLIYLNQTKLYTSGARSIGVWAFSKSNAVIGSYYSLQTIGGLVTGQKYNAQLNGVIDTNGQGVNYFPGTVAGAISTGGQYN